MRKHMKYKMFLISLVLLISTIWISLYTQQIFRDPINPDKSQSLDKSNSGIAKENQKFYKNDLKTSGTNSSSLLFPFYLADSKGYNLDLSVPFVGDLILGFGVSFSFSLQLPVDISFTTPDNITAGLGSDEVRAYLTSIYNGASWAFDANIYFSLFYDIAGYSDDLDWNIPLSFSDYFTTPLERITLPFKFFNYPIIDVPGLVALKLSLTPILIPYITADIVTEGPCITSASQVRWDAYGVEKKIPIMANYSADGSEDMKITLTNFRYNIDVEFLWSCALEFDNNLIQSVIDILDIDTEFPLFCWPRIPIGYIQSYDEISNIIDVIPPVYQSITINVNSDTNKSLHQHPNDWAILIMKKLPFIGELYLGIVTDSKTVMRVPDGLYRWDFYIDGVIIGTGTEANNKSLDVLIGTTNYTINLDPAFSDVTFHNLSISVFDTSGTFWRPVSTQDTGYVLGFESYFDEHIYCGWAPYVIVGADPSVAGVENEYVSLDENGRTEYIHHIRPSDEYRVAVRYGSYSGSNYFSPTYFDLNKTNQGRAVLYGRRYSTSTLIFDNEEPDLNISQISFSKNVKKFGNKFYARNDTTMTIIPTDDLGVYEVNVRILDKILNTTQDYLNPGNFYLDINTLEFEDGEVPFLITVIDYAGNSFTFNLTGSFIIDNTAPNFESIDVRKDPTDHVEINATLSRDLIEKVVFNYKYNYFDYALHLINTSQTEFYGIIPQAISGDYEWFINASDFAGNNGFFDNAPPEFTIFEPFSYYDIIEIYWEGIDFGTEIILGSFIFVNNQLVNFTTRTWYYFRGIIGQTYTVNITLIDAAGNMNSQVFSATLTRPVDEPGIPGFNVYLVLSFGGIGAAILVRKKYKLKS